MRSTRASSDSDAQARYELVRGLVAERFNGYWWRRRLEEARRPHRMLLELSMADDHPEE